MRRFENAFFCDSNHFFAVGAGWQYRQKAVYLHTLKMRDVAY